MQDVGHSMLHLHVAQQLPPNTLSSRTMDHDLYPTNDKDAELNPQFPCSIDLKQIVARLTQVKNEGKET